MKCRRVYATLAATVFALSAGASAREFVLPLGTLLQRMMNEPNSWHASGTHRGFPRRQQAVLPSGGRGKDRGRVVVREQLATGAAVHTVKM